MQSILLMNSEQLFCNFSQENEELERDPVRASDIFSELCKNIVGELSEWEQHHTLHVHSILFLLQTVQSSPLLLQFKRRI